MKIRNAWFIFAASIWGCFYPPVEKPLSPKSTQVTLSVPYDLAWDAVQAVVARNEFKIIADDPNNGILETQATGGFSLAAADCGTLKGIVGKYKAEPDADASAVYNFLVKPQGGEASVVGLQATFTAPLHIPMHPMSDVQCVSRGTEESRLLQEVSEQAVDERRPFSLPARTGPSLLPQNAIDSGDLHRGGVAK
jgi:hypothetical protein